MTYIVAMTCDVAMTYIVAMTDQSVFNLQLDEVYVNTQSETKIFCTTVRYNISLVTVIFLQEK